MKNERLSYTLDEAVEVTGLNRRAIYKALNSNELATFKVGRRRMVSAKALKAFIESKEKEAADSVAA